MTSRPPSDDRILNTFRDVFGADLIVWSDRPAPPVYPIAAPYSELLEAGVHLLNWDAVRVQTFLRSQLGRPDLRGCTQCELDSLFSALVTAISNWHENRIPGGGNVAVLSCRFWELYRGLYPDCPPNVKGKSR